MKKKHKIYRDAISGKIVTEEYAKTHPDTTEAETVKTGSDNKEDEQGERANTDRETA